MKMAYSPTTWNTNDVITKDKLNKIEQGVKTGTLLSGTDIDADKNWNGKNITNIGTLNTGVLEAGRIKSRVCQASANIRYTSPTVSGSLCGNGTEKLILSYTIPGGGYYYNVDPYKMSVRISGDIAQTVSGGPEWYTVRLKYWLRVDGVEKWNWEVNRVGNTSFSIDVPVNPYSKIEFGSTKVNIQEDRSYVCGVGTLTNFKIGATDTFIDSQGW
jgi:hypothetical protein